MWPGGSSCGGFLEVSPMESHLEAEDVAQEFVTFLNQGTPPDIQAKAARYVLGLTGSEPGRSLLTAQKGLLQALAKLLEAPPGTAAGAVGDAWRALVNLCAEPSIHGSLLAALPGLPVQLLARALAPNWPWAGEAAAALANLSRESGPARELLAESSLESTNDEANQEPSLARLVTALTTPDYNPHAPLHYLASVLSNLSQLPGARAFLLDPNRCLIQHLLPLIHCPDSAVRRMGVVGMLRNCCFEHRSHEWLLGPQVELLTFLLMPLAGPEEFSEDEMDRLPVDLQYLPPDKEREPDPDIRRMLIETIMLLTATAPGRQLVKDQGAYLVLRELHSWERDPNVRLACEKLIQVLIGDEPEAGMENLLEVSVPPDVEQRLQQLDQQEQQQLQQEREEAVQSPSRLDGLGPS
ncbi:protein HGH1 homolog [Vombatus ursinus]|uniref:Protein HGH1 homolog n=1 Tax=Vombatus ursinus TaxID=29139 RepID=A0A4X2M3Z6_VOMUR|nr:protein HGH1 homolog [Vombatus ursinus]